MKVFKDYYNNEVTLSFDDHPFSKKPKHVWVICRYDNKWLLTHHKDRGIEFPGGKVEEGETAEEAAVREVQEETGGHCETIDYIGQYYVDGKAGKIVKNVYYAEVKYLEKQSSYFETYGPVLLDKLPVHVASDAAFSFMMKDEVLPSSLEIIEELPFFR
ncbi:RNA deprotection pyrophosphohydrolase [Radiobacillus deserti]|uniref:Nucleoside triphosphatase YtkD n=1 Tax=Radiobacillus deserti TaxID=2594883 RepID=A0A516KHQ4_9BACI|nr:nucleoside triphosphatase YtkD [Radiobacillus deserti]QDP40930.1 nucleoside triphosphatase YtkD [Radiobacillus deserti]